MLNFVILSEIAMTAHKFRIGDPVWAKMKGFSPWPGKVCIIIREMHFSNIFFINLIRFVCHPKM